MSCLRGKKGTGWQVDAAEASGPRQGAGEWDQAGDLRSRSKRLVGRRPLRDGCWWFSDEKGLERREKAPRRRHNFWLLSQDPSERPGIHPSPSASQPNASAAMIALTRCTFVCLHHIRTSLLAGDPARLPSAPACTEAAAGARLSSSASPPASLQTRFTGARLQYCVDIYRREPARPRKGTACVQPAVSTRRPASKHHAQARRGLPLSCAAHPSPTRSPEGPFKQIV